MSKLAVPRRHVDIFASVLCIIQENFFLRAERLSRRYLTDYWCIQAVEYGIYARRLFSATESGFFYYRAEMCRGINSLRVISRSRCKGLPEN